MSLVRKTKLTRLSMWNSRRLHKQWHHWLGGTALWWQIIACFTATEKALSTP